MKNHKKFRSAAIKEVKKLGGYLQSGGPNYEVFNLPTHKIKLTFFLDDNGSNIYSVFGKFDDPRPDLGNPFSGKYNFHSGAGFTQSINQFIKHLQIISK